MQSIVLIAHNLRSSHNVGSLLRTADGLGIEKVYLTGYTPYPALKDDSRMPHESAKVHRQIAKTALGAERAVEIEHRVEIESLISELKGLGFTVAALEQTRLAVNINSYSPPNKIALIVGNEVGGIEKEALKLTDVVLELPMLGKKESFNVAQAAAMALYHLRFAAQTKT